MCLSNWQKYYSPKICPSYWDMLNELGANNIIFMPEMVYDEIVEVRMMIYQNG